MSTVDATQRMVLDHLQIVEQEVRVLLRRLPGHVERDELVATGYLALVAFARRFTSADGGPFARAARPRVRGALLDHLRSLDWASRGVRRSACGFAASATLGSPLCAALSAEATPGALIAPAATTSVNNRARLLEPPGKRLDIDTHLFSRERTTGIRVSPIENTKKRGHAFPGRSP